MVILASGETGADAVRPAEMALRFAYGTVPILHRLMVDEIAWDLEMNRENATKDRAQVRFRRNSLLTIVTSLNCSLDFQERERRGLDH